MERSFLRFLFLLIATCELIGCGSQLQKDVSKMNDQNVVFYRSGLSADAKGFALSQRASRRFKEIIATRPTIEKHSPKPIPFGYFAIGEKHYYWYGHVVCESQADSLSVWTSDELDKIEQLLQSKKYEYSDSDLPELFAPLATAQRDEPK